MFIEVTNTESQKITINTDYVLYVQERGSESTITANVNGNVITFEVTESYASLKTALGL